MKKMWKSWIVISKKISGFLANIVLTVFYIFVIIPVGFIIKLFFPQIHQGRIIVKKQSYWIKREKIEQDIKFAREQ